MIIWYRVVICNWMDVEVKLHVGGVIATAAFKTGEAQPYGSL